MFEGFIQAYIFKNNDQLYKFNTSSDEFKGKMAIGDNQ